MIEIDSKSIQKAIADIKREYSHISEDTLHQAISRALNRTASSARTKANREIRQKYNISASRINNELKTRSSTARTLLAAVVSSGAPLSLNQFQAKQVGSTGTTSFDRKGVASSRLNRKSRTNAKKGVTAIIRKGQEINLPTAFIQVANGGITVFARGKYKSAGEGFEFGTARLPIGKLTTTSIPLMFANDDVMTPTESDALTNLDKNFTHELNWLLQK